MFSFLAACIASARLKALGLEFSLFWGWGVEGVPPSTDDLLKIFYESNA
jgi:hypothetical protein